MTLIWNAGNLSSFRLKFEGRHASAGNDEHLSTVGNPGMKRDGLRPAIEAWNQCNEVDDEVPIMAEMVKTLSNPQETWPLGSS
ncbi:hypothetical protein CCACVL1_15882 [Corchorus capsularis]|uniref:DUF7705 domain-containing protein n=1 Tax=Corchorus capsularis TaxID=210143 RepID=A0A1R3I0R3_COCAP|nr:hypothetical protein CCACVL1_15882 [Corchorus capsularis]